MLTRLAVLMFWRALALTCLVLGIAGAFLPSPILEQLRQSLGRQQPGGLCFARQPVGQVQRYFQSRHGIPSSAAYGA